MVMINIISFLEISSSNNGAEKTPNICNMLYIYLTYIYIYVCVCVCIVMFIIDWNIQILVLGFFSWRIPSSL